MTFRRSGPRRSGLFSAATSLQSPIYVGNLAAQRRRQSAVTVGKERREALVRAKRLCRVGIGVNEDVKLENDMVVEGQLVAQTFSTVQDIGEALSYQGKGALQKRVRAIRELRHLLSRSEIPPVEAAIKAGAVPILQQCLAFGCPDEQLLEAAWCVTNIAAGLPEETRSLLPLLPLLIAYVGEKSSSPVAEQCAWALGNVAGEGEDLRNVMVSQGALIPLARMILPDKGSAVRTAAWALSNLIKGSDPRAATELVRTDGVLDAIIRHIGKSDEELAAEVAWVIVYLSALSEVALCMMTKSNLVHLLVERLTTSDSLQLLIPVLRSLGNLVAGNAQITSTVLVGQSDVTDNVIGALAKCLQSEHRVLEKEAAWVLSNMAAGSVQQKQVVYSSHAVPFLLHLLSNAPFDVRKEVAYVLGNLCVGPAEDSGRPCLVTEHLVGLVGKRCLPGFIELVRSADMEAARLGLQFLELVLRGMPNGEGPKLVEREDGIEAIERFQFHENEDLRIMANGLLDMYFGEDYGLDE